MRWVASYGVCAWLLLEILGLLSDVFGLPPSLMRGTAVVLAAGFPTSLLLARWARGRSPGRHVRIHYTGALAGGVLLVAALAGGLSMRARNVPTIPGLFVPGFGLGGAAPTGDGATDDVVADRRFIAVLPFEHIGGDPRDHYFADGVHEEILTALAGLDELHVISRASVLGFRDANLALDSIGRALGVGSLLTGSVRRGGDRVRISLQLVDPRDGQTVWANSYDREPGDALRIQSEVATEVAVALRSTISAEDLRRLESRATTDLESYDLYLRA
ncbi:MAG: hypothetical protein ACRELC_09600, partial [Gemmatimonadota bacterium]